MQNYMIERLVERISLSPFKKNFIIKGGFLVSAMVGLQSRTTMDLDSTVKGFALTDEKLFDVFTQICAFKADDDVSFEIGVISEIRKGNDCPGCRVSLKANYPPISVPLAVDVTTGDAITPGEVETAFPLLFDRRAINAFTYNVETLLAEKLDTTLFRGIANTRMRDYYDIHCLRVRSGVRIDDETLRRALKRTAENRGHADVLTDYLEIVKEIWVSEELRKLWRAYALKYDYVRNLSFDEVCNSIRILAQVACS